MIRNETEYKEAVRRLDDERERMVQYKARLVEMNLGSAEVQRALDPMRSFHEQLAEEVASYERLRRGELGELTNLHGLGQTLVALRIATGLSQRQLAETLGVHESQVSRDERNEYHGITVERASRILDTLNVHMRSRFDEPVARRDLPGEAQAVGHP